MGSRMVAPPVAWFAFGKLKQTTGGEESPSSTGQRRGVTPLPFGKLPRADSPIALLRKAESGGPPIKFGGRATETSLPPPVWCTAGAWVLCTRSPTANTNRWWEGETRQSLRGARPNVSPFGLPARVPQGRRRGRPQDPGGNVWARWMTIPPGLILLSNAKQNYGGTELGLQAIRGRRLNFKLRVTCDLLDDKAMAAYTTGS